jgi:dethiobiotin synthetase
MITLFVTASGTEIGKTFITTRLIDELKAARYDVAALKPVASGFDSSQPLTSDPAELLAALGRPATVEHFDAVAPWRFAAPLSPDMAAAREHRKIPFAELVAFCKIDRAVDVTLIEGIGGVMVPLDDTHTVLDWIAALGAPALLVVGSYLGSLSHGLTAAAALLGRGCALTGVIVNESADEPMPSSETAATLGRFLRGVPIVCMPRISPNAAQVPTALLPLIVRYLRDRK